MENTVCGDNCPLVKSGVCKSCRECPNFVESWWTEGEQGKPVLIEDCAPKRVLMQHQSMVNRMIGLESTVCQLRDTINKMCSVFVELTQRSVEYAELEKIRIAHKK